MIFVEIDIKIPKFQTSENGKYFNAELLRTTQRTFYTYHSNIIVLFLDVLCYLLELNEEIVNPDILYLFDSPLITTTAYFFLESRLLFTSSTLSTRSRWVHYVSQWIFWLSMLRPSLIYDLIILCLARLLLFTIEFFIWPRSALCSSSLSTFMIAHSCCHSFTHQYFKLS